MWRAQPGAGPLPPFSQFLFSLAAAPLPAEPVLIDTPQIRTERFAPGLQDDRLFVPATPMPHLLGTRWGAKRDH